MVNRKKRIRKAVSFTFPPSIPGAWAMLSSEQREEWLIVACRRKFNQLRKQNKWNDAPANSVFTVDCVNVVDFPGFLCALGEAVNGPGGYFGGVNLISLEDCLYGAFGVTLPFTLRLLNVQRCREALDGAMLTAWARRWLAMRPDAEPQTRQIFEELERDGLLGTKDLLGTLLSTLRFHGVVVEYGDTSSAFK